MSLPQSSESIKKSLLLWKFPDCNKQIRLIAAKRAAIPNLSPGFPIAVKGDRDSEAKYNEIVAYLKLLSTKSHEELAALFEEEKAKQFEKLSLEAEKQERDAVFNQSYAMADTKVYEHYAKMEWWTMDEAIILSLGRNPKFVNALALATYSGYPNPVLPISPFIEKYRGLNELTKRAVSFKKLYDPVIPSLFLTWAKQKDIFIQQPLIEMVDKYGTSYIDWHDYYKQLKGKFDNLLKDSDKLVNSCQMLSAERDSLMVKVAELEANQLTSDQETVNPVSLKEENTYLNIIGGLLKLLLNEKSSQGQQKWRETDIIQSLEGSYPNKQGLKKRTLEQKFSKAKKSLDSS